MGYRCPFCHQICFDRGDISTTYNASLRSPNVDAVHESWNLNDAVSLTLSKCPNCHQTAVHLHPHPRNFSMDFSFSYPRADAISLPDYIPSAIQSDYLEALSIIEASPKAAATLARRCLQGMIHDFWGIREKNLNAEISSLVDKIPASQWKAIDALRKIGNIGAHMEKNVELIIDVDPGEAEKLLKLIELLIEKWYIARHDEEQLYAEITQIADDKESARKSDSDGK